MTEIDCARGVLSELQGMGIGLKLDDFGTGYSRSAICGPCTSIR